VKIVTKFRVVLVAFLLAASLAAVHAGAAEPLTIAVVRDGPPPGPESDMAARVEAELPRHLPGYLSARFKHDPAFDAGWSIDRAAAALAAALADPEVDMVLAEGTMVTLAAADEGLALDKPVVSVYVQRADLFRLPRTDDDRSAKPGFAFITMPSRSSADIAAFRSLLPFRSVHVLVSKTSLAAAGDIAGDIAEMESSLDTRMVTVPAGTDVEAILAGLGEEVEAVYITDLPRVSVDQRRRLIEGLTARGIPTFSQVGHSDVRLGALGALSPDVTDQSVRRAALNLSRLIRGESVGDLPVALSVEPRLLINARTAVALGYTPDPGTRLYASFLHEEAFDAGAEPLTLFEAMRMAEAGSTSLAVDRSRLASIEADQNIARSPLLPQLQADLAHAQTDSLTVFSNAGLVGDGASVGRASLRQMIYDDAFVSGWRASKLFSEAGAEIFETARLDVRASAGAAFLNLGLTKALNHVQVENIRLTRENLELAQLRLDVGYSGRDEIYRWEAQLAEQRSQLVRSIRDVDTATIALNQLLGTDQERLWRPETIDVEPGRFRYGGEEIQGVLSDPVRLEALRTVLVDMALEHSPEMRALRRVMEAQQIGLDQLGRSYFLPSFFLDFSYAWELGEGNVGTFPNGDESYALMVGASYPFFEGGRKAAARSKGNAELEALERQLQLTGELVERETRTAMKRVGSSFARIGLSREAAEVAEKNLELVQEKYAEGVVNVTDLDSAQNQLFVSEQNATASVYEFLLDLVALQRSVARFEDEVEPGEMMVLLEQVEAVVAGSEGGQDQ
jgi:outer membrane protein